MGLSTAALIFLGKHGFSDGRQGRRSPNAVQAGSWIGAWICFFGDARFLVNRFDSEVEQHGSTMLTPPGGGFFFARLRHARSRSSGLQPKPCIQNDGNS